MEYLGTINNGYMFTNKLSGITKGDIVYHYDKLGKEELVNEYKIIRTGRLNIDLNKIYTYEELPLVVMGGERVKQLSKRKGGNITAKYRVVEVYETSYFPEVGVIKKHFKIKVEKIEECNIELSEFVSWKRVQEMNEYIELNKYIRDANHLSNPKMVTKGQQDSYFSFVDKLMKNIKLTKYVGLQKVIYIGGE